MARQDVRSRDAGPTTIRTQQWSPSPASRKEGARISSEAVAKRAYEKFLARGCRHGSDLQDWIEAERELRAEAERGR